MKNELEKMSALFKRFGFYNIDLELDELRDGKSVKFPMMYDNTPELMEAINRETDYTAYLDASTDFIIIEK